MTLVFHLNLDIRKENDISGGNSFLPIHHLKIFPCYRYIFEFSVQFSVQEKLKVFLVIIFFGKIP